MKKVLLGKVIAAWVAITALGLVAAVAAEAGSQPDRMLSTRLDQSLQVLARAQQLTGPAAAQDRVSARRLARSTDTPQRSGTALLKVLVQHTADLAELQAGGFVPQASIGQVTSGTLPVDRLAALAGLPGVQYIQLSRPLTAFASAPAALMTARSQQVPAAIQKSLPADGAGVLIGFIDTGADIFHQDLRHDDGSTRIKYLLDFSQPGDVNGDGILDGTGPFGGTLSDEQQINEALEAGQSIQLDTTGHGTHGLSIAAGDNAAFPGMAPAADLIVVAATRTQGSLSFTSTDIINALAFVDARAAELGQPYVVNLSLGTLFSSHDGRSLEELAIDALVGPGMAGKAVVTAAGNSSDNRSDRFRHLSGTAFTGLASSHTLSIDPYTPGSEHGDDRLVLDLWWEGNDRLAVSVTGPAACGAPEVTAAYGTFTDTSTACGDVFIANMGGVNPLNGDTEAIVLIDDWSGTAPAPGDWTLSLEGEEIGSTGSYNGWLADESRLGGTIPSLATGADNSYLVGKPGGAYHAITVGSYAADQPGTRFATSWTDVNGLLRNDSTAINGDISAFSSPGPTRDGRVKPELTAPGERVRGAVAADAYPGVSATSIYRYHPFAEADALVVDATLNDAFGMLQGTSFSAPVVTGLVARILSLAPELDAEQIRNMLISSAAADSFTGSVPNPEWGHGKVDLGIGAGSLPPSLRITTEQLPDGVVNEQYNLVLTASGGALPYTWSAGSLPPGLSLESSGFLSGVPAAAGTYPLSVTVSDSASPAQADGHSFTLVINQTRPVHITRVTHPVALIAKSYDSAVEASGGIPPYSFSLVGGFLPDGLGLSAGGAVTGTPTSLGSYPFTLQVEDNAGSTALRSMRIIVKPQGGGVWDQLGHGTAEVVKVVVDPADHSRMFCSVKTVGVFASTNAGDSWEIISINNGFVSYRWAADLAISPATGTLFAASYFPYSSHKLLRWEDSLGEWTVMPSPWWYWGDRFKFDSTGTAMYGFAGDFSSSSDYLLVVSHDEGLSWTDLSPLFPGSEDWIDVGVYEPEPDTMYVGAGSRIWLTTDNGGLWASVENEAHGDQRRVAVSQADPFDVVVLNRNGLWRTVNGGRRWSALQPPALYYPLSYDLERDEVDPRILLVGNRYGLARSTDAGLSWEQLSGLPITPVLDIERIGGDPNQLVLGTEEGVYLTSDGGLSWQEKNSGLLILDLVAVAISSQDPQTLFLLSEWMPLVSGNHGDSWTLSSSGIGIRRMHQVIPSPAEVDLVYVIAESDTYYSHRYLRLYRSDNRGVTWFETSPDFEKEFDFVAVAADPFDSEVVMAAMEGSKGVYRSHDRGETWVDAFDGLPFTAPTDMVFAADVEGRVYTSYELTGIYRSDDRGVSWTAYGLDGQTVSMVRPAPSDSEYVYALSEESIWFLEPAAGTWQEATTSPAETVLCLAVDPVNPHIAYAGVDHPGTVGEAGGLYATADGGLSWTRLAGVLDQFDVVSVVVDPSDPATLFAATRYGGVYRSEDTGASWTQITEYGTVAEHINVTVQDPSNPFLLLAGTKGFGVQVSADNGRTFEPRVDGLGNLDIAAIAFDPDDPTTVYAGSAAGIFVSSDSAATWSPTALSAGEVTDMVTDNEGSGRRIWATVRNAGVAYSVDGGVTFSISASGLLSLEMTGIAVEQLGSGRRIWATMRGGDGVACSTDDGETWLSAAGTGLSDRNVNDIAVDVLGRRIWATTDSGVLFTEDAGLSWHEISHGLPTGVPVSSLSIDPLSGEVYVSLLDEGLGGVYRGDSTTGVWTEFSHGLAQLRVGRLTNDGGVVEDGSARTTFFASTQGAGVWAATVQHADTAPPTITTEQLAEGTATYPYTATLSAFGGVPPYSWSLIGGALPAGLILDSATGVITGAAALPGTYSFTVQVADRSRQTATTQLSITILPQPAHLFSDGFESGNTGAWSTVLGDRTPP